MFRCRSELWREDVYLENFEVQMSFDMTFKHSVKGVTALEDVHQDYAGSLYEYSSRHLTYNSDIVNAFAGVLGVLSERMRKEREPKFDHLYGLPTLVFDWALLWVPNMSARRRFDGWPSWSWCGWIGTIAMALSNMTAIELGHWLSNHTWICWTVLDHSGRPLMHIPSDDTYNREKQAKARFLLPKDSASATSPSLARAQMLTRSSLPDCSCWSRPVYSNVLHFSTLSVKLRLAPTSHIAGHSGSSSSSRSYIIYNNLEPERIISHGTIWLEETWNLDSNQDQTYEFLVLADAPRKLAVNKEFQPRAYEAGSRSEVDTEWAAYFVMLVQRDPMNEEIAERVGLGVVYREAIDVALGGENGSSNTKWKEIWLR